MKYLTVDEQEPTQFATNTGMAQLGAWIDRLDPGSYPDLVHLREHGWTEPASALREQLAMAVKAQPPDERTASVVAELLSLLDGLTDEVIGISEGQHPGDDDPKAGAGKEA
jgi:hypothetical protein